MLQMQYTITIVDKHARPAISAGKQKQYTCWLQTSHLYGTPLAYKLMKHSSFNFLKVSVCAVMILVCGDFAESATKINSPLHKWSLSHFAANKLVLLTYLLKCIKILFGDNKYYSVTQKLIQMGLPSFNTVVAVVYNAKLTCNNRWKSSVNSLVPVSYTHLTLPTILRV